MICSGVGYSIDSVNDWRRAFDYPNLIADGLIIPWSRLPCFPMPAPAFAGY
jgi:hypothetical protein